MNIIIVALLAVLLTSCSTLGLQSESSAMTDMLKELAIPPELEDPEAKPSNTE